MSESWKDAEFTYFGTRRKVTANYREKLHPLWKSTAALAVLALALYFLTVGWPTSLERLGAWLVASGFMFAFWAVGILFTVILTPAGRGQTGEEPVRTAADSLSAYPVAVREGVRKHAENNKANIAQNAQIGLVVGWAIIIALISSDINLSLNNFAGLVLVEALAFLFILTAVYIEHGNADTTIIQAIEALATRDQIEASSGDTPAGDTGNS